MAEGWAPKEYRFMYSSDEGTTMSPSDSMEPSPRVVVPTLTVISHPDLRRIGDCLFLSGLAEGRSIKISRTKPDFASPVQALGKPLADVFLSREPFVIKPVRDGGICLSKGGCRSLIKANSQVIEKKQTFSCEEIGKGVVMSLAKRMVLLLHHARFEKPPAALHGLVGYSDCINRLRLEIEKVADFPTPILLRGPSGSGKELVARAIHDSGGKQRPFIAVNMGAIPSSLAASELFGAMKGSFTGSDHHQLGFFRAAEGGTLFLDEIGEASLAVQVLLLRALESGEITPVGAQRAVRVKTHLIAATDADLETKMEEASFKAPLFHRLAGYEISVPPLSRRLEDLGRLFMHFVKREAGHLVVPSSRRDPSRTPWIPASMMERMLNFPWPGNVRQLANVVRQLIIGCRGDPRLTLLPKVDKLLSLSRTLTSPLQERGRKPSEIPEAEILDALRANRWVLKATAVELGISRGTLYQRIEKNPAIRRAKDLTVEQIEVALASCGDDHQKTSAKLEVSVRGLRRRITALGIPKMEPEEE